MQLQHYQEDINQNIMDNNNTTSNWPRWDFAATDPKFHVFPFEQFDTDFWLDFMEAYGNLIIITGTPAYLTFIWLLRGVMRDREPFGLRGVLIAWNVLVALFSIAAFLRVGAEVAHVLRTHGFYRGVCFRVDGHISTAFWGTAVAWSKMFLCMDTVFVVLRKKNLDAAHVVHHMLAGPFSAKMCLYAEPISRWMGFAHMLTHSIDYTLMALTAMKKPVPKSRHIMVALEVMQMLWLIFVSGYTILLRASGLDCMRHPSSIALSNGVAIAILGLVIANAASPEYWQRDEKRVQRRGKPGSPSEKEL